MTPVGALSCRRFAGDRPRGEAPFGRFRSLAGCTATHGGFARSGVDLATGEKDIQEHHPQRRGTAMSVDAPTSPHEILHEGASREWRMYIGGERVEATDGRWTDVMSPSRSGTV